LPLFPTTIHKYTSLEDHDSGSQKKKLENRLMQII